MSHPLSILDVVIGVLIADGLLYSFRFLLHRFAHRRIAEPSPVHNTQGALDGYRFQSRTVERTPLG